jgi:hypothetical protein
VYSFARIAQLTVSKLFLILGVHLQMNLRVSFNSISNIDLDLEAATKESVLVT